MMPVPIDTKETDMTLTKRIATGAFALTLAVGGAVAVPAAAHAAQYKNHVSSGHATEAACNASMQAKFTQIYAGGGRIISGEGCLWTGDGRLWLYSVQYEI